MRLNFKEKLKKLVNILFPQDIKCIFCGEEIKTPNKYNICENCLKNLPYNNKKICKHCGVQIFGAGDICYSCFLEFPNFKIARTPFVYTDKIRLAINKFKFDNAKYFFEPLGQFLVDEYDKNGYDCDIIIPVPLSPNRLQNRHFNQAELLAKPLAKQKNIPLKTDIAKRVKNTNAQAYLNSFDRKLNLENAFEIIDKKAIKNKNILVVDDVMTTGETIKSLCREIVKSKPKSISVLTLAHTVFEENK